METTTDYQLLGDIIRHGISTREFPKTLYKYYRVNVNTINAIKKPYLWYTSLDKYNDPYEGLCNPKSDYTLDEINTWMSRISQARYVSKEHFYKGLNEAMLADLRNSRVCCFSRKCNDILMWAHYADSYKGICVEYDLTDLSDVVGYLAPVQYETTFPEVDYLNDNITAIQQMILTKSKNWKYEREIRALRDNGSENIVPISKAAIKSVIIGPKMQTDTALYRKLMSIIPKSAQLLRCEVDMKRYKLNMVPDCDL